jgi:undecaprenyl-diphosphatase
MGSRRIDPGTAIAVLGVAGFGFLAAVIGQFAWFDAWVASSMEVLRGCGGHPIVRTLTDAAPVVAILVVALAVAVGWRRGLEPRELLVPLMLLTVALLQVQAFKILFERDRPGILPWQEAGGLAYPSGHVANLFLCAVTAGTLMLRGVSQRAYHVAGWTLAAVFVGGVAATRLYLGRHWATDVAGAILLGIAFCGVVTAARPRRPRLLGACLAVELLGLYLAEAAGGRVHLPAPTTLAVTAHDGPAPLRGYRLSRVADGVWTRRSVRIGGRFVRLDVSEIEFAVPEGLVEPSILKMIALPLQPAAGSECAFVRLEVDGKEYWRRPMKRRWRTLAFPLPALGAGPHTIRLTFDPTRQPGSVHTIALHALSLETASSALAITPAAPAVRERATAAN